MQYFSEEWFSRPTTSVAQDLLGCIIHMKNGDYMILETEAYRGCDDPASHAYRRITPRNKIMFGDPGHIYVYLIYGLHLCLNITTEPRGQAGAVLIRSIFDLETRTLISGPGRLCRHLRISLSMNGENCYTPARSILLSRLYNPKYTESSRIGIKYGKDKLWRYNTLDSSTQTLNKAVDKLVYK